MKLGDFFIRDEKVWTVTASPFNAGGTVGMTVLAKRTSACHKIARKGPAWNGVLRRHLDLRGYGYSEPFLVAGLVVADRGYIVQLASDWCVAMGCPARDVGLFDRWGAD